MSVEVPPVVASPTPRRWSWRHVLLGGVAAGALVAVGWWMTGPAPERQSSSGVRGIDVPPLVIRDGAADDAPLTRAAELLADGDADAAKRALTTLAVADPDAVEPQVGLVLARWADVGPIGSIAALRQLRAEHPEDPWVVLELGIAQLVAGRQDTATESLTEARRLASADVATADIARRADDLLHPSMLPGYPPPVVRPAHATSAADRRMITRLGRAVTSGDRAAALELATSGPIAARAVEDPLVGTAAAAAMWSKDDPVAATARLARLHRASTGTREDGAVRLQLALLELWAGRRDEARVLLREVAAGRTPSPWRTQAQVLLDRT